MSVYVLNKREMKEFKEEQKSLNLHDHVEGRVFVCKKDIPCKEGVFLKNSYVFLSADDNIKIKKIYDVSNWIYFDFTYFSCFCDYISIDITKNNFSEYFELNEDLTLPYNSLKKIERELNKKRYPYCRIDDAETTGYIITSGLIFLAALIVMPKEVIIGLLATIMLGLVFAVITSIVIFSHFKRKSADDTYERFIISAKQDMKELAYRGETRAICYQAYKEEIFKKGKESYDERVKRCE